MLKVEARQDEFQPDPRAKWTGLLEKKWTSVIRLQKKVSGPRRSEEEEQEGAKDPRRAATPGQGR